MITKGISKRDQCRSGAALIIVLALVTLVSILLLAYFINVQFEANATQSYSGELTANQIALSGLDRQIADLDQEIVAGSTSMAGPTATSPTYYKPVSPLAMVPGRYTDTATTYTNLIRVSSSNSAQYSAAFPSSTYTQSSLPVNLALISSTLTPSSDGRYISAARWGKPQLMVSGETMPAPDWILMTRSGPTNAAGLHFGPTGTTLNNRTPTNPNYVEGRYAYAVYDEGGLLDSTVAGAPIVATADETGNRGSLALAPLTNSVFTSQNPPTPLITWRNAVTGVRESSYTNYVYNVAPTNGFLRVQPGDNTFLSRQDLIAYANYQAQSGNTTIQNALPYLGTFNHSLNAPAYIPPATAASPNFDFLTLRFANGGTVNSGGNLLQSRTVNRGDFLLTRRFPLSRLAWVTYNGPLTTPPPGQTSAPSVYDIWRAFGLVWDSTNNMWDYVSGAGSSPPSASAVKSTIETLAQVAAETPPRDPDFFELLQAGILNSSIGQTGGKQAQGASSLILGACGDVSGYDSVTTYHIMQIGANILDQASPDSYSIAIQVGTNASDTWASTDTFSPGSKRTFFGVENLPYISRIIDTYERWVVPPLPLVNTHKIPSGTFPGRVYKEPYVGTWLQIELWNPHQQANLNTSTLYPRAIRIVATGTVQPQISNQYSMVYGQLVTTTLTPAATFLQLSPTSENDFSEPTLVGPNDVTAAPGNFVVQGSQVTGGAPFAGLYLTSEYVPDWSYCYNQAGQQNTVVAATPTTDPICITYDKEKIFIDTTTAPQGVTYALQYTPDGHNWYTYSEIKNHTLAYLHNLPLSTQTTPGLTAANSNLYAEYFMKVDPRTDRFSIAESRANVCIIDLAGNNLTLTPTWPGNPVNASPTLNATVLPGTVVANGYAAMTAVPYNGANATWSCPGNAVPVNAASGGTINAYYLGGIEKNASTSSCYYTDHDGAQRRGDAAYASGTDGFPGVANTSAPSGINLARPVILNRPFRSVGELGYAFRDLPFKTLDFFTKDSGDAALLDLFSVSDADVVAGRINVNTHNSQALAEVFSGGALNPLHVTDGNASLLSSAQATALASALVARTAITPVRSLAELVTSAVGSNGETILSDSPAAYTSQDSKIQREAAIRTLGEAGNARTWNLMIDIIAQSGRYPPNLQAGASFDSFIPNGEKHYWLHVAIDRFTGRVVDRYLEPVHE